MKPSPNKALMLINFNAAWDRQRATIIIWSSGIYWTLTYNMNKKESDRVHAISVYQKAIALQYEGRGVPLVTATGEGAVAEQIIDLAKQLGVPLYENAQLTELLSMLELGDEIPHDLYVIIAQIIALAYTLKLQ